MPPKPLKKEFETEDSWRYMADLPLGHVSTMKRVMVLIYHKLNPLEKIFPLPQLNWTFLTRQERKRAMAMIVESNSNDLLEEMLHWFSAQFMGEDQEVVDATQTLKKSVTYAVRNPKSYQVEYLNDRKKWNEFLGKGKDADVDISGMGNSIQLTLTPHHRPSEFITSVKPQQGVYQDSTQIQLAASNTVIGTETSTKPTFKPSYSHQAKDWKKEISFNTKSAIAHYNLGGGKAWLSDKQKQEDIEVPYSFTPADEDVSTESDPDDVEVAINIFETTELPGRKTRGGKEFSGYVLPSSPKKENVSPGKAKGFTRATGASKAIAATKNKTTTSKSTLAPRADFVDEDEEIYDSEPDTEMY
ncbi:hypothetical protein N431DRAFT_493162 [Stipitochalara longipes BDJ]|nr:hypothetical protein N431DRAFT_493162 [Stipitochalara longipes BDJ]